MSSLQKDVAAEIKAAKEAELPIRNTILRALESDNPLIQEALKQERAFRIQTEKELKERLETIQTVMANKTEEEATKIKNDTLAKLDADLELMKHFNTALATYQPKGIEPKNYTANDTFTCTFPAKFNFMTVAITGAKTLISMHFENIFCDDALPAGYLFHSEINDVTILGNNPNSIYGDSKGTFLKTALIDVALTCTGGTRLQEYLNVDQSAIAHVTALPLNLNLLQLDPRFDQFTYGFSDGNMRQGFCFVHSGYAFGGHRDTASRYLSGTKIFGPEDCSSWIAKICGSPIQFSTTDQLYNYRLNVLKNFQLSLGNVPAEYSNTPIVATMTDLFDPVVIKDPQRDIRPGQIYAHRVYDLATDATMQGLGSRGHTGLVIDFVSAGKDSSVMTMTYGRKMPTEEGFGIQTFPLYPEDRQVMLFSVKSRGATGQIKSSDAKSIAEDALIKASSGARPLQQSS